MEKVKNCLLIIFALGVAIGTNIGVGIYGWGLQPVSWFWVIGMSLIGGILVQVLIRIATGK